MKTILAGVFVFGTLVCCLGTEAGAQTATVCVTWVSCGGYSLWGNNPCSPAVPPGATNCSSEGGWTEICEVVSNQCAPPPVWCPKCGRYIPVGGSPINLTNGNTYIEETDVKLPGLGGGLTLTRTWNSIIPSNESGFASGMFGLHWFSTYGERVFSGSGEASGYVVYLRNDGGLWYFNSSGSLVSPANDNATLAQNGTQSWTITFKDGEKRVFSYTSGSIISIADRNGNTTNLTYDATNRLTTVTDPASRHLYFSYGSGSSSLVTSVTSDFGVSASYAYDSQGRLTQVTEPDQSTLNFDYNSQSLIADVKDSSGVILESHTYDSSGRGLTSARASGVEAITITYPF